MAHPTGFEPVTSAFAGAPRRPEVETFVATVQSEEHGWRLRLEPSILRRGISTGFPAQVGVG